jgi:hypothetical protein
MESQLGGGDVAMIGAFRKRLDVLEIQSRQVKQLGPDAARLAVETTLQLAIEALDAEIRATL